MFMTLTEALTMEFDSFTVMDDRISNAPMFNFGYKLLLFDPWNLRMIAFEYKAFAEFHQMNFYSVFFIPL